MTSFVYFAQDEDGLIKIGTSEMPLRRVKQLRLLRKQRIELLGCLKGGFEEEHALHLRFAAHRVAGEWFKPHSDVLSLVADLEPEEQPEEVFLTIRVPESLHGFFAKLATAQDRTLAAEIRVAMRTHAETARTAS